MPVPWPRTPCALPTGRERRRTGLPTPRAASRNQRSTRWCSGRSLGVLVVALLVVLGRHTVDGRIEVLGSRVNGVVGLLEGQGDAATIEIDVDHLDEHGLARLDHGLRVLDVTVGELGDMHQALDAVFDGDEDTELDDLGDLALDNLGNPKWGASETLPRILLGSP